MKEKKKLTILQLRKLRIENLKKARAKRKKARRYGFKFELLK